MNVNEAMAADKQITAEIKRLRRDNKRLSLKSRIADRLPFCPDHRDKVSGKPCRECEIERLRLELKRQRYFLWLHKEGNGLLTEAPWCSTKQRRAIEKDLFDAETRRLCGEEE